MATQKTDLLRYKIDTEKLWGIYRGVVEDRNDPLRLGRVRIRIMGVHTEEQAGDLNKVPWQELCWAHPINGLFGGSMSDIGAWTVPLQGSHVMVFFENGNMMQPRYFGTVPGFPIDGAKFSQLEKQDGYIDPDEEYPLTEHIEEHDWNRLARIDKLAETYLQIKKDNLDKGVDIAFGGTWDENPPMYDAEYPDNNVFATWPDFDENMVVELDATKGKNRIAWWHPSMSYMEVNFEGRMVIRNTFHRYDICDGTVHEHTMEDHHKKIDLNLTTIIDEGEWREIWDARYTRIWDDDWKFTLFDDLYWVIGDFKRSVIGSANLFSLDAQFCTSNSSMDIAAESYICQVALSNLELGAVGEFKMVSFGGRHSWVTGDDTVLATGKILLTAGSKIDLKSSSNITCEGMMAYLHGTAGAAVVGDVVAGVKAPLVGIGSGTVMIGPVVQLGVTPPAITAPPTEAAPAVVINPDIAAVPGDPTSPPGPPDLYEPEPEDVPVEMPEPAC